MEFKGMIFGCVFEKDAHSKWAVMGRNGHGPK